MAALIRNDSVQDFPDPNKGLRRFSAFTSLATLFLIYAGGLVTSTGSGLSVPDWPLSYGMLFPPMVGGVFYEHGHRMVASSVGLCMLSLAVWIGMKETRKWLKNLAFFALAAVIAQGILGGITVLLFLPTPVSVTHGMLAQTFFVLTIVIAYSFSKERARRLECPSDEIHNPKLIQSLVVFLILIYVQLAIGAVMRHTHSGLAIPDFPTIGGMWVPSFDAKMIHTINDLRFEWNLDPVTLFQVMIHFVHRVTAIILAVAIIHINAVAVPSVQKSPRVQHALTWLNFVFMTQILLGILTVLSVKDPVITSLHVVTGAAVLGLTVLLILRTAPTSWKNFKLQLALKQ